jgi:hypothetical protein
MIHFIAKAYILLMMHLHVDTFLLEQEKQVFTSICVVENQLVEEPECMEWLENIKMRAIIIQREKLPTQRF